MSRMIIKQNKLFLVLALIATLLAFSLANNSITIDSGYKIVVDFSPFRSVSQAAMCEEDIDWISDDIKKATACTESFAGLELRKYLEKLETLRNKSEKKFEIICLDEKLPRKSIIITDLAQRNCNHKIARIIRVNKLENLLHNEGSFAIVPWKKNICIIGYERTGALYGVYHLLGLFGVRWYSPGEYGEILPSPHKLTMTKKTIIENPSYLTRGFWAWEPRGNEDFFLWMARNKLNLWTFSEKNHAVLNKLGIKLAVGGHIVWKQFLGADNEYPYNHKLFKGDENKPEDPYGLSNGFRNENNDNILNYFEAHPEWYGMTNGQRVRLTSEFGTNICTSNEDALNEFCHNMINSLVSGEWKGAQIINLWPLDGGLWCECNTCRSLGSPSDRLIKLIDHKSKSVDSARAQGLLRYDVKIFFPVYLETESPPAKPLPADFNYSRCIATFFPIWRCYSHFIDDSTCIENNLPIWNNFIRWTKQPDRFYQGQACIGEYYNVSRIKSLPLIVKSVIQHEIPLYCLYGVRHFHYMHVSTGQLGPKRFNNYLLARMLWDTGTDADKVFNEYLKLCYGSAESSMRQVYSILEKGLSNVKQVKHLPKSLRVQLEYNSDTLFPLEHLKLKPYNPVVNKGLSLEESIMALKDCRAIIDSLLISSWPCDIAARLYEDDKNLRYAENTYNLFYFTTLSVIEKRNGNIPGAKSFYSGSIHFANELKNETEITSTSSSHANAANGLEASGIEEMYIKLGKELGFQ